MQSAEQALECFLVSFTFWEATDFPLFSFYTPSLRIHDDMHIIHDLIHLKVDYYIGFCVGFPLMTLWELQLVQNTATCLLKGGCCQKHMISVYTTFQFDTKSLLYYS